MTLKIEEVQSVRPATASDVSAATNLKEDTQFSIDGIEQPRPVNVGDLVTFVEKQRVYQLKCNVCGAKGGEIRFPENHGRKSDQALEEELKAHITHTCDEHRTI